MRNTRKPAKDKSEADTAPETADLGAGDLPEPEEEPQAAPAPEEATGDADPIPSGDATPQEQTASDDTADVYSDAGRDADAARDDAAESVSAGPEGDGRAASAPPVTTEQVVVRQGGFWSMLLGGCAAAAIGVGAAPYILPSDWFAPGDSGIEARVDRGLAAQEERLNDLTARIEGQSPPPDLSGAIDGLGATLTALTGQLSALEARLAALESRPLPEAGDSVPAAEIADLRAMLETQRAALDALTTEAQAAEAAARDSAVAVLRRAALSRILTALDSGSDFTGALNDLRETGVDVPEALAAVAERGVPTQTGLVEGFPDAARAALALARAETGVETSGMSGFLKSQLGLRSLSPREGDDPDAVLSRAEAALRDGRLGDALAEIETLPDAARTALAEWVDLAMSRKAALAAAEALAGTLN